VVTLKLPLLPDDDAPVRNETAPLAPAEPALAVAKDKAPLEAAALVPDRK
jgi:hypothetical protein